MGNSLCKQRIERASNSKSPVDRVIGRCAQICPNSFGSNKPNSNYWKSHILETSPPTRTQPKSNENEWRTATLNTVSQINPPTIKCSDVPIAPPRKKRNTLQRKQNGQPGGFKEVFGTPSRRSSCDSFPNMNISPKRRNSSGDIYNDDFTDFSRDSTLNNPGVQRKISKVGNKKSDKFLGENLSGCLSDSPFLASTPILGKKSEDLPTTLPKDALDTFVDSNISKLELMNKDVITELNQSKSAPIQMHIQYSKEPDKRPSLLNAAKNVVNDFKENTENLDRKAEFLMTMLDGNEFEKCDYSQLSQHPDEVLTAPKRRRSKNIPNEELPHKVDSTSDVTVEQKEVKSSATSNHITATIRSKMDDSNQSDSIEQPIEVTRNIAVEANNLKINLPSPQKKKEFTKSNPDSPNIYAHLQPVEHELIVPIRNQYKHICDDDDAMHKHHHAHKHSNHKDMVDKLKTPEDTIDNLVEAKENKIQANATPKKPDRDFTRYKKSEDLSSWEQPSVETYIESQILRPERKKGRIVSRESLPSPPPRPIEIDRKISLPEPPKPAKSRKISLQEPKRGLFEDQKLPESPVTPINTPILNDNEYEKIETFLKKCSSSQSFLTKELMDQLVEKVYGYSRNWDDQMEEGMLHTKCNDGSEKVGPSSKLTTRKISLIKKETPTIIQEEIEEVKKPTFSIGPPDLMKTSSITEESSQPENTPLTNNSSLIKRTDTVLELLPGSVVKSEVQSNDSSSQTQNISEAKKPTINDEPNTDLELVKVLLKSTEIHQGAETNAIEDIYKKNQEIMDDFKNYLEDKKINEEMMSVANKTEVKEIIEEEIDKSRNLFPDHIDFDSLDPVYDSDTDSDVSFTNKRLAIGEEPRRGSIVDHDQWFLKHTDLSSVRRGSDCPTTYDTRKLFPFGKREKVYSESNDFFSDDQKKSKSSDHINLDSSNELDHSKLLKYFNTKNVSNPEK